MILIDIMSWLIVLHVIDWCIHWTRDWLAEWLSGWLTPFIDDSMPKWMIDWISSWSTRFDSTMIVITAAVTYSWLCWWFVWSKWCWQWLWVINWLEMSKSPLHPTMYNANTNSITHWYFTNIESISTVYQSCWIQWLITHMLNVQNGWDDMARRMDVISWLLFECIQIVW